MGHYLVLLGFYGLDCARRAHENHLGLTVGGGGGISAEECAGREKKSENSSLVHGSNQSEWSILCRNVSSIIYCSYLKKKVFVSNWARSHGPMPFSSGSVTGFFYLVFVLAQRPTE